MSFNSYRIAKDRLCGVLRRCISTAGTPNMLQFSPILMAEPLKKKKRIDPAIVRAREEKRKKKLEKQIRKLEKVAKTLKPIEEVELPLNIVDQKEKRIRQIGISEQRMEEIIVLKKQWSAHMNKLRVDDLNMTFRIANSQLRALDELRKESEELYQAAVQIDPLLMGFTFTGPTDTPPIEKYHSPDGDYFDVSKKWK